MRLPGPLRCSSVSYGDRCDLPRFHPGHHGHRETYSHHSWSTETTRPQTYETDAPWVTWTFLSTDRETRVTGRSRVELTCCICGRREIVRIRIPRFGEVPNPPGGVHPERAKAKGRHAHPGLRDPSDWALPFRNWAAWQGGIPLDAFENVARTARMEEEESPP